METETANYKATSRSLQVHLVNVTTINSSKEPKSHVKFVTYMNNDNGFDILVSIVFYISPKLISIRTNAQNLVTSFKIIKVVPLPGFNLQNLQKETKCIY